jgi:hypothetical protein
VLSIDDFNESLRYYQPEIEEGQRLRRPAAAQSWIERDLKSSPSSLIPCPMGRF